MRVRRYGTSYAHPFIVLITLKNNLDLVRVGIMVNKSVGGAVTRNRCKRQLRSLIDSYLDKISSGWDLILIAKSPIVGADYASKKTMLQDMLIKAELIRS